MSIISGSVADPIREAFSGSRRRSGAAVLDDNAIGDMRFWRECERVRDLQHFLSHEHVAVKPEDLATIAQLDALSFHRRGRSAGRDDWQLLLWKESVLLSYFDERLRWRHNLDRLRIYFRTWPVVFLIAAVLALVLGVVRRIFDPDLALYAKAGFYGTAVVLWTLALGGLGACAFLGTTMMNETARMNKALQARADGASASGVDFDLTDQNLIGTRIIVGILFALLLGIPLAAGSLSYAIDQIADTQSVAQFKFDAALIQTIGLTLLPFVIGFSTPVVLGVMDRLVAAVRTIFGMPVKS